MTKAHVVLYRKYRPQSFRQLIGQRVVVRTLRNAVRRGEVAHAYLFSGPRGTGKTTAARLLAKAVNCERPDEGDSCRKCASCRSFVRGTAIDLIEIDAASNRGIDDMRALRKHARYRPAGGREARKLYLIDEAHMLTEAAANALLKLLEEPPDHVLFVLATTEAWNLPKTILSRTQRFDFARISVAVMVKRLMRITEREEMQLSNDALQIIATEARGSMRDALVLLEQVTDGYGDQPTIREVKQALDIVEDVRATAVAAAAVEHDLAGGLQLLAAVQDEGVSVQKFQRQIIQRLRSLLHETDADVRDRVLTALHAFGDARLTGTELTTTALEVALATCVLRHSSADPHVSVSVLERPTPSLKAPRARVEKAQRVLQEYIAECSIDDAFSIAQEVGVESCISWKHGGSGDTLVLSFTDLQLVAYASALSAHRKAVYVA